MTIQQALHEAGERLAAAGVPNAHWDAELLLLHVLAYSRAQLLTRAHELLGAAEEPFLALIAARATRRPLQHLTGRQEFWRREFEVSPDALIPRPETELLVAAALARLASTPAPIVIDVGTGSGCIALSIACERPDARVHAIDISPPALRLAHRNASRLGCSKGVRFHEGDLLAPVAALLEGVDAIVSNPPYVDRASAATLAPEVRDHEPAVALFPEGEVDAVYRRLVTQAPPLLRPGGWLILEIGVGPSEGVPRLCGDAGLAVETVIADWQGIPRVVVARRHPTGGL